MLFFFDGTSGGRIGTKQLCPGYVAAANRRGGLTAEAWHFAGLFPYSDAKDTQLRICRLG